MDDDLALIMSDAGDGNMLNIIDKIDFGSDCGDYYAAPINLFWDMDRNGIFEAQGNTASSSAALLDGPTIVLLCFLCLIVDARSLAIALPRLAEEAQ